MADTVAVVAGGTGLVGSLCVEWLLPDDEYSTIVSLVRRTPIFHPPRLEPVVVDFEKIDEWPERKVDQVFCALGTTIKKAGSQPAFRKVDFDYVAKFARWAQRCGASQFCVVSSVGADPHSSNFYLKTKGEMEDAVASSGIPAVHIFRPSLLLGERNEQRAGEAFAIRASAVLKVVMVAGWRKYHPVEASMVARAMIAAANQGTTGTHVYHYEEICSLAKSWSPHRAAAESA